MIQRRHFLGSVAAFLAAPAVSKLNAAKANPSTIGTLNWQNDVIETVPHNRARRSPVVTGVSLQPANGNLLAIVGDDHFICLYDIKQQRYIEHLDNHNDWVRTAKFSPDGSQLATAGNDRKLLLWAKDRWDRPATQRRHPAAIIECAFSNDGKKLATVGFESTLRVYDSQTGKSIQQLRCACADNHAVAFSADDTLIAAGGRCGTIRVWDLASGRTKAQFKAHKKRIRSIDFTPEGKLVSASDDQTVQITDVANPQAPRTLPRHASKLYSTALLSDGMLATCGSDNQIHIWHLDQLQEIGPLKGHTGTVTCLDYSSGKLVSGSYDTHVRLWRTETHTSAPVERQTQRAIDPSKNGWNPRIK